MALGPVQTIGVGIIGVLSLYGVSKSLISGTINLGGKGRDFFVTFAHNPGLYIFGVLFMLALGVGCLVVAWKQWSGDE